MKYGDGIILHRDISTYEGEEEPTRAFLVAWLCVVGGYLPANIELEKEYTLGRPKVGGRLDILVRRPDGTPFALIEVKAPSEFETDQNKFIKGQLFEIAPKELGCSVLAFATVRAAAKEIKPESVVVAYQSGDTFERWSESRPSSSELPLNYGEPTHEHFAKGGARDLRTDVTSAEMDRIRKRLHDVLWRGSKDDNLIYSYVVKLLLAKIHDEKTTESGSRYRFQVLYSGNHKEPVEETFERISALYVEAYDRYLNLGGGHQGEALNDREFSAQQIAFVVELLQGISLDGSGQRGDLLGAFFEGITRDGFKQSKGLFFTHWNLAVFMLEVLEVRAMAVAKAQGRVAFDERLPYIIDPSCGSGTFLLAAMKLVTDEIVRRRAEISRNDDVRDFVSELFPEDHPNRWARESLFGIDYVEVLAMSTKVNMILKRDGSTHIYHADGLEPFSKYADPMLKSTTRTDGYYGRPESSSFDVVISNPPFSITLDPQTSGTLGSSFVLAADKNSENLFLERWYQLLKEGGRLGAVMPESFFSTQENLNARLFLFDHFNVKAVVGVPRHAFEPWTPTRTALLFASKKTQAEEKAWVDERRAGERESHEAVRVLKKALGKLKRLNSTGLKTDLANDIKSALSALSLPAEALPSPSPTLEELEVLGRAIRSVDEVKAGFDRAAKANKGVFKVLTVTNIGYKRTKRREYDRANDLFVANLIDGQDAVTSTRVLNLNHAPGPWRVIVSPDGSDALSLLHEAEIWG